ncbi:MAG: IS200/IS605 family accessory protein TnpB-related protein [Halobacillus sp.]|uniref:IS200/IS605 family accessory protein TnpB-related protein n=1 Tax=Halobacillus sp. TaxID=56800 RepID=UPI003BB05D7F
MELDQLMRVFGSTLRFSFNRLLEGYKKRDLIKLVNAKFHMNKRYAEDAVMQAEQIISSQKELLPYQIENLDSKIEKSSAKIEDYKSGKKKPKNSSLEVVTKGIQSRIDKLNTRRNYLVQCRDHGTIPKVIFGGRKNFEKRMKGNISNQEWKDLRSNMLYARGDKAKNGNLNTRVVYDEHDGGFYLEIANPLLSEGNKRAPRLRYKLKLPEKFYSEIVDVVMPDVVGFKNKKAVHSYKPYSIEIRRKNGFYYVFITYDTATHGEELKGRDDFNADLVAGIDINIDRVTVSIANRHGNKIKHRTFYCHEMEYVSSNRRANLSGEMARDVVNYLLEENVGGLVLEDIKLKQDHDTNKKTNRLLHSFSKNKLHNALFSRANRNGLKVKKTNPAYTSVIGCFKYQEMYGMSIHEAASFVIARRGMSFDEKIPKYLLEYLQKMVSTKLNSAIRSMEEMDELTEKQQARKKRLKSYVRNIQKFKKNHSWKLWNVIHKTLKYDNQGIQPKEV